MGTLMLVKKTQREWMCGGCLNTIKEGSMMIRDITNKWVQTQVCLNCGKEQIEHALVIAKESVEMFEESNDLKSAYQMFKENKEYYEDALRCITNDN